MNPWVIAGVAVWLAASAAFFAIWWHKTRPPAPGDQSLPGAGPPVSDADLERMIERWRRSARD